MTHYPRKRALLVLVISALIGVVAWGRVDQYLKNKNGGHGVEALERQIADERKAGAVSAATWRAYAQALVDAREYAKAAAAFKEVLALEPAQRDAKFQCGLALAQSGNADDFYAFQKELVYSEAKLAVELFDRAEAQRYLAEERFSALAKEAKNQAMD